MAELSILKIVWIWRCKIKKEKEEIKMWTKINKKKFTMINISQTTRCKGPPTNAKMPDFTWAIPFHGQG